MPRLVAELPHSKNLRFHRCSDAPGTFFVTKNIQCDSGRKSVLHAEERKLICSALHFSVEQQRISLAAFVVMPDHWHALLRVMENWTLPRFMHAMMSFVGAKTARGFQQANCKWQDGYYETLIGTARQFDYVRRYINLNPVRRGLVALPEEWDAIGLNHSDMIAEPWPWLFDRDA